MKKIISILLALIVCLCPLLSLGAAAVSFPEGVSRADVQTVLPKVEKLADSLMSSEKMDIKKLIYDMLFTDATVNSIIEALYVSEETQETAQTLSSLGVDFSPANVAKGLEMTLRSFGEVMERLGVKEIESLGKTFDPELHNAVFHVDDESYGEQEIVEVLQKGYTIGDKVLRYAMVKVAN